LGATVVDWALVLVHDLWAQLRKQSFGEAAERTPCRLGSPSLVQPPRRGGESRKLQPGSRPFRPRASNNCLWPPVPAGPAWSFTAAAIL
jgi:hypothetical protein